MSEAPGSRVNNTGARVAREAVWRHGTIRRRNAGPPLPGRACSAGVSRECMLTRPLQHSRRVQSARRSFSTPAPLLPSATMNADLKRVRESSLDGGPSSSKRRAVSQSAGGSSPASSHTVPEADDDGVEDWMRVVETKRKEAIYRQMLQYRRAYEREQSRAAALERQQRAFEASVQGYKTCWAQVSLRSTAIMDLMLTSPAGLLHQGSSRTE